MYFEIIDYTTLYINETHTTPDCLLVRSVIMKRRLYFLLPHVASAEKLHNELLLARIEERNMHILARDDISLKGLPEASILEKSDIIHGLQLGFILGGFTGIALASFCYISGLIVPGWETLSMSAIVVGSAFVGAWASSMIVINMQNTRLKHFMKDVNSGQLLYMVDVPVYRIDEITNLMRKHHPEVSSCGIEPTIPAFP